MVVERGSSGKITRFVGLLCEIAKSGDILPALDADDPEYPRHAVFSIPYGRIYISNFPERVWMVFEGKNMK